jgi:Ca2+-binding EF-hand superfamily protein
VAAFVQSIPDLTPEEQKFIISYLYQSDKDSDGKLTFDELKAVIASFGAQKAKVTVAQSVPSGTAASQQ